MQIIIIIIKKYIWKCIEIKMHKKYKLTVLKIPLYKGKIARDGFIKEKEKSFWKPISGQLETELRKGWV